MAQALLSIDGLSPNLAALSPNLPGLSPNLDGLQNDLAAKIVSLEWRSSSGMRILHSNNTRPASVSACNSKRSYAHPGGFLFCAVGFTPNWVRYQNLLDGITIKPLVVAILRRSVAENRWYTRLSSQVAWVKS